MDCGPSCLRMIAKHYGRSYTAQVLREKSNIGREGVSLLSLSQAAEKIGFRTTGVKLSLNDLAAEAPLPCVVHWNQRHYVIVYKISRNKVHVADPARGLVAYTREEFLEDWAGTRTNPDAEGIALLLEPTPAFYEQEDEPEPSYSFSNLFSYLFSYKKLLVQLILSLLSVSILQLIMPFLSQSIIDVGINTQNLNFIYLVLIAQIMLFVGKTSIEFIRGWILLYISSRINISILSDFLIKLMRLPLSFFDVKVFGDIMQRIGDHQSVERFLTGSSLLTFFSLFNLVIFGGVLAYYDATIFLVFLAGSLAYTGWILIFFKRRRKLNFKRFQISAKEEGALIELIGGMQEIKLANSELQKRRNWEALQAKLFKVNIKNLSLNQHQQAGASFINEGKNLLITFLAAKAVVTGDMTLGAMLAVQYIIGQLNSPIEQLIAFLQSFQEAKISLERLNEIHQMADEEPAGKPLLRELPENRDLSLQGVSFRYAGSGVGNVLENINLHIPQGKTTAIVGTSGSGKTTLLKLLLRFYEPTAGEVKIGEVALKNTSHYLWRSKCGVVMQDGFIFSDTIAQNIAVGEDNVDVKRLVHAAKVANIHDYIESLPMGYNTRIGADGNGNSQGQKQRLLIARAVYKKPEFIFFDEATNALDANNESIIMKNLDEFFIGRTVVVVAHRLSTVRNADQIIVMEKGRVVEQGTHFELVFREGKYYELVKNQLELGQ